MTKTEITREVKEQQGTPELKGERRRIRNEMASEPPLGVHRATLVYRGTAVLIGLRYVRGETGVPILVCRAEGEAASDMFREAQKLRLKIVDEHVLAHQLFTTTKLGTAIPMQYFEPIARALLAAGLA